MRIFKMQYIKNGTDGVMLVEAKDRWDAIKFFLKRVGKKRVSDLDYFHDEEVTVRVKTCFECTAYVDIDGEQSRCWLDRDPLKCDRKMAIIDKFSCTSL